MQDNITLKTVTDMCIMDQTLCVIRILLYCNEILQNLGRELSWEAIVRTGLFMCLLPGPRVKMSTVKDLKTQR